MCALPYFQVERSATSEEDTGTLGLRQRVSQVYSAAANVISSDTDPQDWESFARLILEATYEAVLWAAIKNIRGHASEQHGSKAAGGVGSHRVVLRYGIMEDLR